MMKIGGLQRITLLDYPGHLACIVFLTGCNFRCPWCYSSELVLPEKIAKQPIMAHSDFYDFLKRRKGQLEGVVICGGEPTINSDLPAFCRQIKKMGYKIKLDTNGSNPTMLKDLLKKRLVDYLAMDIKAPLAKYSSVVGFEGCSNNYLADNIQKSVEILKQGLVDYEFRTTFVPGIHTKEDIADLVKWLKPAKKYFLQHFRPEKTLDPIFAQMKIDLTEEINQCLAMASPFFEITQVR